LTSLPSTARAQLDGVKEKSMDIGNFIMTGLGSAAM
jgi:hypothetical protein